MKYIILLFILTSSFFFTACSTNQSFMIYNTESVQDGLRTKNARIGYINYKALSGKAVESIFATTEKPKKLIVTDFADITSLDNHSRLGYVLSNSIKDSLINVSKIDVVEAEVSKYFKISGNGIKILSRDTSKLRSTNFDVRYAVVGTYTHSNHELLIFVKLIDLKNGIIKGSYAKSFLMGEKTRTMLHSK